MSTAGASRIKPELPSSTARPAARVCSWHDSDIPCDGPSFPVSMRKPTPGARGPTASDEFAPKSFYIARGCSFAHHQRTPAQAGAQDTVQLGSAIDGAPSVPSRTSLWMSPDRISSNPSWRSDLGPRLRGGDVRSKVCASPQRYCRGDLAVASRQLMMLIRLLSLSVHTRSGLRLPSRQVEIAAFTGGASKKALSLV